MNKSILLIITICTFFFSCKKDVESPGINISSPVENAEVKIGETITLEGLAVDEESLKEVHYKIQSTEASYAAVYEGVISLSGTNEVFKEEFSFPYKMPIGDALISFYSVDEADNVSEVICQNLNLIDNIEPEVTLYNNEGVASNLPVFYGIRNMDDLDSIEVTFFKNEFEVFDSLVIYNYTQSLLLASITDLGGFRFLHTRRTSSGSEDPFIIDFDLTLIEESVYKIGYKVRLADDHGMVPATSPTKLLLFFKEYDFTNTRATAIIDP